MTGGNSNAELVTSWQAGSAGDCPSALPRLCHRTRVDAARSRSRTATRTDRSVTEAQGMTREVVAGSTLGRWPNTALQRIAAR
jgi:hypothetical protein